MESEQRCGQCKWFAERRKERKQTIGADCLWPMPVIVLCAALEHQTPNPKSRHGVWREGGTNCHTFERKEDGK